MIQWHVYDTRAEVTEAVIVRLLAFADEAIRERGRFVVALSGGGTPIEVYQRLGADAGVDLSRWVLLYADDRCLPIGHADRNDVAVVASGMAARAGVHLPMPAELGPESAARLYASMLAPYLPLDVAYLGIGPDGHTASLFPGHALDPVAAVVGVHASPKPPPERVSLGLTVLRGARERLVHLTGEGKRDVVSAWRAGADLPIQRVCAHGAVVYLDRAAERT